MTMTTPRDAYERDGCISTFPVLTPSEARKALSDYEGWAASLEGGTPTGDDRFKPHLYLPFASGLVRHPKIVDVVSAALGTDDVLLWSSDFNVKEPGSGGFFALHQDATYTGLDPARKGLTVWLALSDPVDDEHGCMTYLPGSHRDGQLPHSDGHLGSAGGYNMLSRGQQVDDAVLRNISDAPVTAQLRGGEASLHSLYLLHKSGPNQGRRRRVGLAMRYIAAEVRQTGSVKESVTLVRGCMRHDGFELEPSLPSEGVTEEAVRRGKAAHVEAMRRESANYFKDSTEAAEYT